MKPLTLEQLEDVSGGVPRIITFTDAFGNRVDLYLDSSEEGGDPFSP